VRDRFGDNGLTGVVIVEPDGADGSWVIDTLLLSCRVMGRGVETALLGAVLDEARRGGARALLGSYIPTQKNSAVRDCYARHGFTPLGETNEGATLWTLDPNGSTIEPPRWLQVRTATLV
jgi:FkbH-like protein